MCASQLRAAAFLPAAMPEMTAVTSLPRKQCSNVPIRLFYEFDELLLVWGEVLARQLRHALGPRSHALATPSRVRACVC
eukprot:1548807-Pleurochrysis_carterae.AAC.1